MSDGADEAPVPLAERVAVMPVAAPGAGSVARGDPRDP